MTADARGASPAGLVGTRDERRLAFARSAAILALEGLVAPNGWASIREQLIEGSLTLGSALVEITGERRGIPDIPRPRATGLERYIDPITKVSYNKLGLRRRSDLAAADYRLADLRLAHLMLQPIRGRYDLEHLEQVHRHLYSDLYDWAGEQRRMNFSRTLEGESGWKARFAPFEQIGAIADAVRRDLGIWNTLNGLARHEFISRLTAICIKLNYMHPFLKGNGRVILAVLSQLAHESRHDLRFEAIQPREWSRATVYSMPRYAVDQAGVRLPSDETLIRSLMNRIARPLGSLD